MTRYNFRVKSGSELEKAIGIALDHTSGATKRDLGKRGAGLHSQLVHALHVLGENCDNFSLSRHGVSYADVVPTTIIQKVSADRVVDNVAGHEPA